MATMSPSTHRVFRTGIGTATAPARARCKTCDWESGPEYGFAATSRVALLATAHRRCPACDGSQHAAGGDRCETCCGTGWRP